MIRPLALRLCAIFFFLAAWTGVSHAAGPCSNDLINLGFQQAFGHNTSSSGVSGECNPNLYIGVYTQPLSASNARTYVMGSKFCSDPWIGEIYALLYPATIVSPTTAPHLDPQKCLIQRYSNGHWANNGELLKDVQAYMASPVQPVYGTYDRAPKDGWVIIDNSKIIRDSQGRDLDVYGLKVYLDGKPYAANPGDVMRIVSQTRPAAGGPSTPTLYLSRN